VFFSIGERSACPKKNACNKQNGSIFLQGERTIHTLCVWDERGPYSCRLWNNKKRNEQREDSHITHSMQQEDG